MSLWSLRLISLCKDFKNPALSVVGLYTMDLFRWEMSHFLMRHFPVFLFVPNHLITSLVMNQNKWLVC